MKMVIFEAKTWVIANEILEDIDYVCVQKPHKPKKCRLNTNLKYREIRDELTCKYGASNF